MAEARVEDEEETFRETREAGGTRRNARAPTAASDRADRNKPEQRQSSTQGALSSIRAVIKRTSTRTAAPTDQTRERRRPEITILAAEPLASNSWFPGTSGAFPMAPPPVQPSWTSSVTVELPPPSYAQVIREKSREQNTHASSVSSSASASSPSSSLSSSSSSSAPRHTATISTQTDPEASEPQSCTKPSTRRPPKPPRPSLPLAPKPAEPVLSHTHSLIELDVPDPPCSSHTPTHPPCGEQCGIQTEFTPAPKPLTPIILDTSHMTNKTQSQAPGKQEVSARPRPRPRSKAFLPSVIKEEVQDHPTTREVKVQTLVRLKDNGTESVFSGFTETSLDTTSNKYLQDLLDVFGCDEPAIRDEQHDESVPNNKNAEEESVALESCSVSTVAAESLETITRPEPRPRTQIPKQRISIKPIPSVEETITSSEEQNNPVVHPLPAPRPLVKKVVVSQDQGSSEEKSERCPPRLPPRPALAARGSGVSTQEDGAQPAEVPSNPGKPVTITSSSRGRGKCPAKPPSHRRPPPPSYTPAHTPAHTPPQISSGAVSSVSVSKSSPSLPHQSSEGELLPLRPPPIKLSKPAGSSVNPAKNNQHSGSRGAKRGPPLPPRPVPGHPLYRHYTSKSPQGTNKVNPPSSEPGESHLQKEKLLVVLDDAATNQQPTETPGFPGSVKGKHQDSSLEEPVEEQTEEQQPETNTSVRYRAHFAFNGEDGELTFRDGDVITLIAYVNEEWGRGSLNGRTGIFPLNFVQLVQENPEKKPTAESHAPVVRVLEGQTGRALYDFTPESEDELCLKVGDVVSSLEEVDDEWFVGELAGRRGIIPKNYIQLL
ncbi:SH3 domain-containing protein 19 isoform X1 [Tachysurus fulvidraco]|uniref:SH3 domain-containing protein 19 isoform X1 n=2 Tax=Tachysurus fulvidraco TaxID=1234273 RepID=UPI001FEEE36F|nr:SH3 domain-containing protein 19 isoform X1 [Tachysurus fulvidraco]